MQMSIEMSLTKLLQQIFYEGIKCYLDFLLCIHEYNILVISISGKSQRFFSTKISVCSESSVTVNKTLYLDAGSTC